MQRVWLEFDTGRGGLGALNPVQSREAGVPVQQMSRMEFFPSPIRKTIPVFT
jgi:hypothetical protein